MKTVFLVNRINNYRHFAPLIEEGLKRNHHIECWHDYSFRKDSAKGYLFPDIANSPFHKCGHPLLEHVPFENRKTLNASIVSRNDVTFFVSLSPPEFILDPKSRKHFRGSWCIIMHGPDSFKEIKKLEQEDTVPVDSIRKYFFPYTEHLFDLGMQFFEQFLPFGKNYFSTADTKVHAIGCSMFGTALRNIDPSAVRQKFDIPEGKNILLYLPYTFSDSKKHKASFAWQAAFAGLHIERKTGREFGNNAFSRTPYLRRLSKRIAYLRRIAAEQEARTWLLNGWSEPAVIRAVRAFCDNNRLHLVVKPRRKFDFSEEVYRKADIIIDDDESQQYPSKLQELFSIASLCMGYFSTAVIESVFCDVPFINLHCPDALFYDPHQHFWCPVTENSLFSFRKAVRNVPIPDLIRRMPTENLSLYSMDSESREGFMTHFSGPENPTAGERFFDFLENTVLY